MTHGTPEGGEPVGAEAAIAPAHPRWHPRRRRAALTVVGVGVALGWQPTPGVAGSIGFLLTVLAGTFAFASLGLFLAGLLRAEATLAAANLVYLLLLAGGAVVLPASSYGALGSFVQWLPSGALGEASRAALTDGLFPAVELVVLLAWGALGTVLTARTFSWE